MMKDTAVQASLISMPRQQRHGDGPFPLALQWLTPDVSLDAVEARIGSKRQEFSDQAHRHGAVLFRGFPPTTAEDFDRFVAAFALENFPYEDSLSNAVRVDRTPRVITANEAPPAVEIFLHYEMTQTPLYPSRLFFSCERPAEQGGDPDLSLGLALGPPGRALSRVRPRLCREGAEVLERHALPG